MDLDTASKIAELIVLPAMGALAGLAKFAYNGLASRIDSLTLATEQVRDKVATQNGRLGRVETRIQDHLDDDRAHIGGF